MARRFFQRRFSPIQTTATLSVVGLIAVVTWKIGFSQVPPPALINTAQGQASEESVPKVNWQLSYGGLSSASSTKNDPDGLSNIGPNVVSTLSGSYAALQGAGEYSPSVGGQIANDVASTLRADVSYQALTAADIKTDPDTSFARMLTYRADMRVATEPLLKNKEAEYAIFARYLETHDAKHLETLKAVAQNYREAIARGIHVVAPIDAASYHLAILNSLSRFAATLDAMSNFADDPFASAALLQSYNEAEAQVLTSFNSEATYYRQKKS